MSTAPRITPLVRQRLETVAARKNRKTRERAATKESVMLSQIATVTAEAVVVLEMLLGAALLLLWVALEVIGYAGLLFHVARTQRWLAAYAPSKPVRDIRWGVTVRAAGLRRN